MANPRPPATPDLPDNVLLQKFAGLKNTVTTERLGPDEQALAVNVDLDDVGQFHLRRGRTRVATGNHSSLFTSSENVVYAVKNGSLGIVNPDFSFDAMDGGYPMGPLDRMAYVQVGASIYFSSRTRAGIINQPTRTVGPWGSTPDIFYSPVVNPTVTLPAVRGRLFGKPPLATSLAYWNGRIYLANGRQLWATELFLYNFVDKTKNFLTFEADITMVGSVTDGLYVGTKEGVWFLSGPFNEMKRVRVMDTPCIQGSLTYVPGELANPPQVGLDTDTPVKVSLLFLTQEGYCGGQDGGVCYNYTESRFIFPDVVSAHGIFRRQDGVNQFLVVGDSGGTPSANTRIGDFVDAELIRGGGWGTINETIRITEGFNVDVV